MDWVCKIDNGAINVFYKQNYLGQYILLKKPYCEICACPEVTTESCKRAHSFDCFDRVFAMAVYYPTRLNMADLLSDHVLELKRDSAFAVPVGLAMGITAKEVYPDLLESEVLVPVPLSSEELSNRGFNQSLKLAKVLGEVLKLPTADVLNKTRSENTKKGDWQNRKAAAEGLYTLKEPSNLVKGKRVAIIDDVMTTGFTCSECAFWLKFAGATSVNVFVAGRTIYSKGK